MVRSSFLTLREKWRLVVWQHPDKRPCRLSWRLSKESPSTGKPEGAMRLDGRHPAGAVSYHNLDGPPPMIRVSVYLLTEDVLHLSHDR